MSLDKRLDKLEKLPKGWDGYGGLPPSKEAIAVARSIQFMPMCGRLMICIMGELVTIDISPDGKVTDVNVDLEEIL